MKLYTICALSAVFLLSSTYAFAQRRIGNTRSDQSTTSGASSSSRGDRSSTPPKTTPAPVHYSPAPAVVRPPADPQTPIASPCGGVPFDHSGGNYPVPDPPVIFSVSTVIEAPPYISKSNDVELYDSWRMPGLAGYDFSDAEVVPCDDQSGDMYFTNDSGICWMSVGDDTDIQDLGDIQTLAGSRQIPGDGWSPGRVVPLVADHAYAVWQWDGRCSRFVVSEVSPQSVVFSWVPMGSIPRKTHGPMFER